MNAVLALQAVPGRAAADALHPLLDDPNPRLRLIAARRVLAEDAADPGAVAVVADAMSAPAAGLRMAATDLLDAVGPAVGAILEVLRGRSDAETDPEVRKFVAEAVERLERIVASHFGESIAKGTTQPENTQEGEEITRLG